ncbi:cell division protein FtsB [Escherichia coli]|uniref:Cell division protein FtsB n=1 Tax=Escherichia coli TaxID=562 RepID=A0A376KMV9_ECOLX|nr:cell division protein FtsB [Escherichia coli]
MVHLPALSRYPQQEDVESSSDAWDDDAVFQGGRMGKLTLLLLAILVWLQYSLWFGKNGYT